MKNNNVNSINENNSTRKANCVSPLCIKGYTIEDLIGIALDEELTEMYIDSIAKKYIHN